MEEIKNSDVVVFDLDDTLAPSKSPISIEMGIVLGKLLKTKKVAIISGASYVQLSKQFVAGLPKDIGKDLENLSLFPTSGASMYTIDATSGNYTINLADTEESESNSLTSEEKIFIKSAILESLAESSYTQPEKIFGEIIEDRDTQITFSALGQDAPLELKHVWDPDHRKREKILEVLIPKLVGFEARFAGSTSIDITRAGKDKAYGIMKISKHLKTPIEKMIFIGDSLSHGGNDEAVKKTGIRTISVTGPDETLELLKSVV